MNSIRNIQRINELELKAGTTNASWHDEFKDSAYVYVGGLDTELTEGDVITIMSQWGEIASIEMPRDKATGKRRGFAFIMYEDQRSTVLAVDNGGGAVVLNRTLRVDHVRDFKHLEEGEDGKMKERETQNLNALPELIDDGAMSDASSHPSIDVDDPMRDYLLAQARSGKKRKGRDGETKDERRARKAAKREKKERKALRASDGRGDRSPDRRRSLSPPPRRRDDTPPLRRRDDSDPPRRRDDSPPRRRRSPTPDYDRRRRDDDRDYDRRPRDDDRDRRPRDEPRSRYRD